MKHTYPLIRKTFCFTRVFLLIAVAVFTLLNLSSPTYALSDPQKQVLESGIYYFNVAGGGDCSVNVDVSLSGSGNAQQAYNYFVSKGLTPIQASAILGNFMRESHMNPKQLQGGGDSDTVPLDGKTGYGLAQWTDLGRQKNLAQFAKDQNQPVSTLALQLDFVWHEASSGPVLNNLKAIGDINIATEYWMDAYENPGVKALAEREAFAKLFYDKYGSSSGSTITVPSSDTGGCSSVGPGQNTQYVDGFTVYSQFDPAWINAPYGSSTVGDSGCGPSAMAMIITALTGKSVTPDQTAAYGGSQGTYDPGVGSYWTMPKTIAPHWGLKATFIGNDVAKITASLQSGGLVIVSGHGAKPFSTVGHYIVIRGVTSDGNWKIGDSGHNDTSDKKWSPSQLSSQINDGSVYVITK